MRISPTQTLCFFSLLSSVNAFNLASFISQAKLPITLSLDSGRNKATDDHTSPNFNSLSPLQDPRQNILYKAAKVLENWTDQSDKVCDQQHTFLSGNFAPVSQEHAAVPIEVVEGKLPSDLDGLYIRNGPNPIPQHGSSRRKYAWIDGHGMLHSVRIKHGKATYSNSYIPTPRYNLENTLGEEVLIRQGEYAAKGGLVSFLLGRVLEKEILTAANMSLKKALPCNNSVLMFRDKFYCMHEASVPFQVEVDDHGCIVQNSGKFDNFAKGDAPIGAHSQVDPASGNLLTHTWCHAGPMTVGQIFENDNLDRSSTHDSIGKTTEPLAWSDLLPKDVPLIHDTAFTENWRVIFDGSQRIDPKALMNSKESLYQWNQNHNLRIGLVPRSKEGPVRDSDTDVLWFDAGVPLFLLHAMNAWEDKDGTVVVWAPTTTYFSFETYMQSNPLNPPADPFLMTEFRINPEDPSGKTSKRRIVCDKHSVDAPHVRPGKEGRPVKFGFAGIQTTSNSSLRGTFQGITTYDMEKRRLHRMIEFPPGEYGGEISVIPKTGKTGDNEVYLGLFSHNIFDQQSYFVLYDGETGSSKPVARLRLPHRVPFGFHGMYVEGRDLKKHIQACKRQLS